MVKRIVGLELLSVENTTFLVTPFAKYSTAGNDSNSNCATLLTPPMGSLDVESRCILQPQELFIGLKFTIKRYSPVLGGVKSK